MLNKDWIDKAMKEREAEGVLKYGPIKPKSDKRCFRKEALLELIDSLNYISWAFQKGEINRKQYKWLDTDIRRAIRILELACSDRFEWEMSWMK